MDVCKSISADTTYKAEHYCQPHKPRVATSSGLTDEGNKIFHPLEARLFKVQARSLTLPDLDKSRLVSVQSLRPSCRYGLWFVCVKSVDDCDYLLCSVPALVFPVAERQ